MAAATIRRPAPGAGAGPDLRAPSVPHLALVSASASEAERAARTPQEAFAARMRAARERRGIALDRIADATKVSGSLFAALERGDVSRWPKGIYKRAFFRGYAAAIGLPPDSTTEEFLGLFPDEKAVQPERRSAARADVPALAPAPLRLTLAPDVARVPFRRRYSRAALMDVAAVLAIALVLAWLWGLDARVGLTFAALCCYPQCARLVRNKVASRKAPRGTAQPAFPAPEDSMDQRPSTNPDESAALALEIGR